MNSSRSFSLAALPRLLYTHNPFYSISALLVLYGIYRALPPNSSVASGWLFLGMLCGYTLALALASYVVIRFGQVWDDARTILLTLALLFVALSAGFDQMVLDDPSRGAGFLLLGLLFVGVVSEAVLRSLKIRLAAKYRAPYYFILTLLFCYPALLGQLSKTVREEMMPWFVLLFPAVAGVAFLTLFPAARETNRRQPPRGSRWTWPWYPWSLFFVLMIATGLRSYSFSLGFESGHGGQSSFEPFFLLPLLFAGALLLLELGISAKSSAMCKAALVAPLGLLLLALPGHGSNPVATRLLTALSHTAGSPVQLTAIGLAIFYAIAWIRGLCLAEIGFIVCVSIFAVVDRQALDLETLALPSWLPLGSIALVELGLGLWRRVSWRQMLAVLYGIAALSCVNFDRSELAQSNARQWPWAVLAVLLLGVLCDDPWARIMRRFAWPLIPLAGIFVAWDGATYHPDAPRWAQTAYFVCAMTLALAYWHRAPAVRRFMGAMVLLMVLAIANARWLYLELEQSKIAAGLPWLAWGSASLTLALMVSFAKGGLVAGLFRWLRSYGEQPQQ